ncbi:hypothetical protein F5X96DRAFT_331247 [Biscogniauxia mediterranea]|nr:hypothetical protein F5X96DRAFT_331247 [Biscogniauxia mediterranea]
MRASSMFVLAASAMSAAAQTTTSTGYLTATVTITKCSPQNTACPLYSSSSVPVVESGYPAVSVSASSSAPPPAPPSTSSYPVQSTTSVWYPAANSTIPVGPTGYSSSSIPAVSSSSAFLTTSTTGSTSYPTTSAPASTSAPATGAAGSVTVQSGLLMAVLGMGAALLA